MKKNIYLFAFKKVEFFCSAQ